MNKGYYGNINNFAYLIANNIYNPISSIVEMVANYYDADADIVKIYFKIETDDVGDDYVKEIKITGSGHGFTYQDLLDIQELVNSKKKDNVYTEKFNRVKLGSFGIALASFQILGSSLEIYSKIDSMNILYRHIEIESGVVRFSDISYINCDSIVEYETGCTFILKNCNLPSSIFSTNSDSESQFNILKNKLSYLPINDNFKIFLLDENIKREIINDNTLFNLDFQFNINEIIFEGRVYYTDMPIKNDFYKGIYLKVNDRIIDWNILDDIIDRFTTPGVTQNRVQGYFVADNIKDRINIMRNGLTDISLSIKISNVIRKKISTIYRKAKKYYDLEDEAPKNKRIEKSILTNAKKTEDVIGVKLENGHNRDFGVNTIELKLPTTENQQSYNESQRKEKVFKRIKRPNSDLQRIGIQFCYEPENEIEVIIIASQMCQKNLLCFDILQTSANKDIDCIILPHNENMAFLEFEKSLENFYSHNHNHNKVDYILCWDINIKELKSKSDAYVSNFTGYIKSIEHNDYVPGKLYREIIFNKCDGTKHTIKLYVLIEIIKKL